MTTSTLTVRLTQIVAETIRESKRIPSGHLYAAMMTVGISLDQYQRIVDALKNAGLIIEQNNELIWEGF